MVLSGICNKNTLSDISKSLVKCNLMKAFKGVKLGIILKYQERWCKWRYQ